MPRIPTYVANESAQQIGVQTSPKATAAEFGGGDAAATSAMGGAILDTAAVLEARKKQEEGAWTSKVVADAETYWQTEMEKRQESAEPGAKDFTPKLMADFDKYVNAQMKNAPTGSTQRALQETFTRLSGHIKVQGMHFEAAERVAQRSFEFDQSFDKLAALNQRDPAGASARLAEQQRLINGMGSLPPSQRRSFANRMQGLGQSELQGWLLNNPAEGLRRIQAGEYDGRVDPNVLFSFTHQLKSTVGTQDYMGHWQGTEAVKSAESFYLDHGHFPVGFNLDANLAMVGGKPGQQDVNRGKFEAWKAGADEEFKGRTVILNGGPQEIEAHLGALAQDISSGKPSAVVGYGIDDKKRVLGKLVQLYDKQKAMLEHDSAMAALQDPTVASKKAIADEKAKAAMTPMASPEVKKAAHDAQQDYLQWSIANQVKRGVNPNKVRVIQKQDAEAIAHGILTGGSDQVEGTFAALKDRFGAYAPQALSSLQAEDLKKDSRISGLYTIIGDHIGEPQVPAYIRAIQADPVEMNKYLKEHSVKENAFEEAVAKNPTMKNLDSVLQTVPGRESASSDYTNGISTYAKYLFKSGLAPSVNGAVDMAVGSMFNKVRFSEVNGAKFTIPKMDSKGVPFSQDDSTRIDYRLKESISRIASSAANSLVPVEQFGTIDPRLKPEETWGVLSVAFKERARWVNSPNGDDSVTLMFDKTGYNSLVAVKDAKGNPISYRFEDLATKPWADGVLPLGRGAFGNNALDNGVMNLPGETENERFWRNHVDQVRKNELRKREILSGVTK